MKINKVTENHNNMVYMHVHVLVNFGSFKEHFTSTCTRNVQVLVQINKDYRSAKECGVNDVCELKATV